MPLARDAGGPADQSDQGIACGNRVGVGTGVANAARSIHFSCSNAREPDMRPFGAPDRTITVPDPDWCAVEGLTGRNNGGSQK